MKSRFISGSKRILITGCAGSIGSELARQLYKNNKIYGLDFNEMGLHELKTELGIPVRVGDIRNKETLRDIFDDFKPEYVFHAAAYKSVDMLQYVPEEAVTTNILGTMNMLYYAKVYEVKKFITISTDKAVNPKSVMGASKLMCEMMTRNAGYTAVRFGNVLGSRGSLIQIWERQINRGEPITITDEKMMRYFMTIPEAVSLVIKASKIGKGGETICFEMGNPVSIKELAEEIIQKLGRDIEIQTIGNRGGEVMEEYLMTAEEKTKAIKMGDFYVL